MKSRGFTLVELIIVIVVIAVLATITTLGLTMYQKESRDGQRSARATSIAEALEKYYDTHGEYPSCAALTQSLSTTASTISISEDALVTPNGDAQANAVKCQDITSSSGDIFSYVGDSSDDCQTTSCLQFTLKYREEATGNIVTITSRRTATIASSGSLNLTGTPSGYAAVNLTWTSIINSTGYTLQRSTSNTFSSPTTNTFTTATTSTSVTGLTSGQTYYFRIKSSSPVGDSDWSTISVATNRLGTPTNLVASTTRATTINVSWGAVTNATGYSLDRSTSSSFASGVTTTPVSGTTYTATGETPGTTAYFRVRATRTDSTSLNSNSDSATPVMTAPSAPSVSAGLSGSNAVGTASVVSCVDGTPEYQLRYHSEATSTDGAWSGWNSWSTGRTYSVGYLQGNRYVFQAQARCNLSGSLSSVAGANTAQVIPDIATPAAPAMSVDSTTWTTGAYHVVNYVSYCPAGTYTSPNAYMSTGFDWNDGIDFWHNWGYNDWWDLPGGSNSGTVRYTSSYVCYTAYKSTTSNQSTHYIYVTR
jgi:prepilin-type N-terminal cleavage/methylation domain-containing protein